ncbi:MAG: hypothetical protein E3J86_03705 [Candidatus Thorarchaeota archaeon]|nr:MAG: hypothetical protein E3J86_03705 [Candidatus Thorarchaeota archaeon]
MRRRNYLTWGGLFLITLFLAMIFIFFPPLLPLSPYAGDILGSMIGFMLVMTFAEIVKLDDKRDRAKKIEADIRKEITKIAEEVRKDALHVFISMDIWDLAISTGDLALVDSKLHEDFMRFYEGTRTHNWIEEKKMTWLIKMTNDKDLMEGLIEAGKKVRVLLIELADSLKKQ